NAFPSHASECSPIIFISPVKRFDGQHDLKADPPCRFLSQGPGGGLFYEEWRDEDAHLGDFWDSLFQHLEVFVVELNSRVGGDPCDVATRSRQALDKTKTNWIRHHADDRDCRGQFLEHELQTGAKHKDNVRLEVDRIPNHVAKTF